MDDDIINLGMKTRAPLTRERQDLAETLTPLNYYAFFESLTDRLLLPMQLECEIMLQDDKELIFQDEDTARRVVVQKFKPWVPQLQFNGEGQIS